MLEECLFPSESFRMLSKHKCPTDAVFSLCKPFSSPETGSPLGGSVDTHQTAYLRLNLVNT
ncbi:hypothetical protein E2C01_064062 [Portunus trituberculatus]|uniref:Uncharacterized protein n=1 Tax=Portunus trituberculatus TaxID=210409 RepID=A0A5B7HAR2_PORTR|nr:hypothetical protein [Portunus trituberculatus]